MEKTEKIEKKNENNSNSISKTLQFSVRSKTGVNSYLVQGDLVSKNNNLVFEGDVRMIHYSADGKLLGVLCENSNLIIFDTESGKQLKSIQGKGTTTFHFSPLNTFVLTYERITPEHQENNLAIWDLSTGEKTQKFTQRQFVYDDWPFIKWTNDESIACRKATGEIHIYKSNDFSQIFRKLPLNNVAQISLSPQDQNGKFTIAAFCPETEKKGSPGFVYLYSYPNLELIASKSFFKAHEAKLMWNSVGKAIIILTHVEVDKSGKSYYGESHLYYLTVDGKFDCNIQLKKEGPIYDCSWNPNGKEFVVTYGFMPAQTTLFDNQCKPVLDMGEDARNTAKFAPHSNILCVAGFGNLTGYMDFWDPKKLIKLGSTTSPYSAFYDWSPNSAYMLTAVLTPRMRVDNGLKLFKNNGEKIYSEDFKELYEVMWKPSSYKLFEAPKTHIIAKTQPEVPVDAKPVGRYVPPHKKNLIGAEKKNEPAPSAKPTKYKREETSYQSSIPGDNPVAKAKAKKKKPKKKKEGEPEKKKIPSNPTQLQVEEPTFDEEEDQEDQ